ncbi:MAG TPA: sigma 54-interacting transcriptional regulator, partial [Terriglobales bacterium]|nr:sigma 54-interacting transcriptional regulator [Terriglobales bacterium]
MPVMASSGQESEYLNAQLLVDSIPALIHTGRPDGYLDYFNKPWLTYFGVTLDKVVGWNWTSVIHPEDVEGILAKWRACLATGEIFEYEARVRGANGEYRWMFHRKVPLRDANGNIVKWYGSSMDIHERKTAEEALRSSEAYLAEAQRLSRTGSFGWKPDTGEIVWSDETYRIFEYDRSVKPTIDSVMQRVHLQDRADFQKVIDGVSRGATDFEQAYRLLLPDGRVKHVHAIAHAVQNASGDREFIGAVTDITERKTTEDKIRRLVEAGILGIFIANLAGEIVEANQAFLQMLQYDRQDLVAGRLRWADMTPAELHERDQQAVTEALANGFFQPYEKQFFRKDGARLPVLLGGTLFPNSTEGVSFALDLSEQKRAEEGLRQSQERFRLVLESIGAQVISTTVEGELDFVNQPVLDYFGKTMEQLKDWRTTDVLHPDDLDSAIAVWKDSIEKGLSYDVDHRFRRSDGVYRWFHVRGRPQRDVRGSIVRWYALLTDIEDRKWAEDKIREQESELRQIVDLVPQVVAVFGPDGERLYANRIGLDYAGLSLEEWRQAPGNAFSSPSFLHPDDRERAARAFYESARPGDYAFELELRLRKRDGTYRWFLARYNPLSDKQGQITRWYVAFTDIEDRKRAEDTLRRENVALREEVDKASMFEEIVGTSPALQIVLSRISKVAPSDSTVLITGETGTGKELVAWAIHRRSDRSSRAFVSVNCAAILRDLIASELFGHEKGAFTGAIQQRLGRFELANGGTLFLDEVGELPAGTQVVLLRVLQEHEFERVGGTRPIRADVRVIAATNRDLQAAISAGSFRSDLFYRLHVFPIEIPPLRERREDIRLLVEYFIDRYARKAGKHITTVEERTLQVLQSYPW